MGNLKYWLVLVVLVTFAWGWYLVADNKVACKTYPAYYTSSEVQSADLTIGTKNVTTKGANGVKEICTKRATKDQIISSRFTVTPVNEIVTVGTKPLPTPTPVVYYEQQQSSCPVTTCNDGSCSYSTGRGTCSWHGGVAY